MTRVFRPPAFTLRRMFLPSLFSIASFWCLYGTSFVLSNCSALYYIRRPPSLTGIRTIGLKVVRAQNVWIVSIYFYDFVIAVVDFFSFLPTFSSFLMILNFNVNLIQFIWKKKKNQLIRDCRSWHYAKQYCLDGNLKCSLFCFIWIQLLQQFNRA